MDFLDSGLDDHRRILDAKTLASHDDEKIQENCAENVLCGEGLRVCFKDIEYTVRNIVNKKECVSLLKGASGTLYPGHMTALLGPSGSGKTTLLAPCKKQWHQRSGESYGGDDLLPLPRPYDRGSIADVLAGRKTQGTIKGDILFAARTPRRQYLQRYVGYVEQFDTLLDNLTVYEQLLYTCELKNAQTETMKVKKARVEAILSQLAMGKCRNTVIGSPLKRGISGGECKRVNIGIALVARPRVLLLDEPTSGLDSYTANEVMSAVRGLTGEGMTILATIHAPTSYCFALFDRLMVLIGGYVIYNGPNGAPAVEFFEETNPDVPPCGSSKQDNPAEWIVRLTTKADREGKRSQMAEKFTKSPTGMNSQFLVEAEMASTGKADVNAELQRELSTRHGTNTSFLFSLKTILKYRMRKDYTDVQYLFPRSMDKLFFSLMVMTVYWKAAKDLRTNLPDSDIAGRSMQVQTAVNIAAMLFMWAVIPVFTAMSYMPGLVIERAVFYRERADGLYTPLAYLLARIVEEVIITFASTAAFSTLAFFPVFMSGSYVPFFMATFITSSVGVSWAYLVAAISPSMAIANAIFPSYLLLSMFFVGQLIRLPDIPGYWKWIVRINPLHYPWLALMVNQFKYSNLVIPFNGSMLQFFAIEQQGIWNNLGYGSIFFAVYFLGAWLVLTFVVHQKR